MIAADLEDRRQPNGSDPQAGDVVQMVDDTAEIAADERLHLSRLQPAIRRGGKAIHHDLVDDGFVSPGRSLEAVDDVAVEGGWLGGAVDAKFVGPTPSPSPSPSEEEGSRNGCSGLPPLVGEGGGGVPLVSNIRTPSPGPSPSEEEGSRNGCSGLPPLVGEGWGEVPLVSNIRTPSPSPSPSEEEGELGGTILLQLPLFVGEGWGEVPLVSNIRTPSPTPPLGGGGEPERTLRTPPLVGEGWGEVPLVSNIRTPSPSPSPSEEEGSRNGCSALLPS